MLEDKDYTTAETAEIFGVSPRTIQRWLREGPPRFPQARKTSQHPNSPWLIPAGDIGAELKRQRRKLSSKIDAPA